MMKIRLGENTNWLKQCGYSLQEEAQIYDKQLEDVLQNTKWYLDNFVELKTYRVRWKNDKSKTPTLPYKYVKSKDL